MNEEQKRAIWDRIGELEDYIHRDELEAKRSGCTLNDEVDARRKAKIAKLKEGL